jgi:hypothetical protein
MAMSKRKSESQETLWVETAALTAARRLCVLGLWTQPDQGPMPLNAVLEPGYRSSIILLGGMEWTRRTLH